MSRTRNPKRVRSAVVTANCTAWCSSSTDLFSESSLMSLIWLPTHTLSSGFLYHSGYSSISSSVKYGSLPLLTLLVVLGGVLSVLFVPWDSGRGSDDF